MQSFVILLHKSIVHLYCKYDMHLYSCNVLSGILEENRDSHYFL